jgi:hypothetical protein
MGEDDTYLQDQCEEALDKYLKARNEDIQLSVDLIRMALSEEFGVAEHVQPEDVDYENQPAKSVCPNPECGMPVFCFWDGLPNLFTCPFCTEPYYAVKGEDIEIEVEFIPEEEAS